MNQMQHDLVGSPVAQDYTNLLGTPFKVFLSKGVEVKFNHVTRKTTTEITDLPGLITAIVQSRVLHPRKLSGDDLRYIRSALALKSSEAAKALDMTPEHYSRCENGKRALSPSAEKFYRMFVFLESARRDKELIEAVKQRKNLPKTSEEAKTVKKALEAFHKLFHGMEIDSIHSPDDVLEFSFFRRDCPPECDDCGDGDSEWQKRDAA